MSNHLFVSRMDVSLWAVRISSINDRGHSNKRNFGSNALPQTCVRKCSRERRRIAFGVGCQLNEIEAKVLVVPFISPVGDPRGEQAGIVFLSNFGFPLILSATSSLYFAKRGNRGVIQDTVLVWIWSTGEEGLFFGFSDNCLQEVVVFSLRSIGAQTENFWCGPCLNDRSSPVAADETDGDLLGVVELLSKKPTRSAEVIPISSSHCLARRD